MRVSQTSELPPQGRVSIGQSMGSAVRGALLAARSKWSRAPQAMPLQPGPVAASAALSASYGRRVDKVLESGAVTTVEVATQKLDVFAARDHETLWEQLTATQQKHFEESYKEALTSLERFCRGIGIEGLSQRGRHCGSAQHDARLPDSGKP
ncbi:MAG: hypothetical protein ACKVPX_04310 [Myxococcaceae bacterium]